jgi:hypothetical protein
MRSLQRCISTGGEPCVGTESAVGGDLPEPGVLVGSDGVRRPGDRERNVRQVARHSLHAVCAQRLEREVDPRDCCHDGDAEGFDLLLYIEQRGSIYEISKAAIEHVNASVKVGAGTGHRSFLFGEMRVVNG